MLVKKSSRRLKERRQRTLTITYALVGVAIVLVISFVAYLTRLSQVTISSVQVVGAEEVAAQDVERVIQERLSGTYGLLIPKRLAYAVPMGALRAAVIESLPPVQSVTIERSSLTTLTVQVTERVPAALWCSGQCYRVDAYGYVFAPREVSDQLREYRGEPHVIGETILGGVFHDFNHLVDEIELLAKTTVSKVRIEGTDAFLATAEGTEIRFLTSADPARTLETLSALYGTQEFQEGKVPAYIELRFADKTLVKFK